MPISARHLWASLLFLIGISLTIFLGFLTGSDDQPSRSTSALLVVLAGVFQFASASQFKAIGRADPGLARAAVRRLIRMGTRTQAARKLAEAAHDSGNSGELRSMMGQVSVELSWLEEGIMDAVDDWNEFHKDAIRGLMEDHGHARQN